MTDAQPPGTPHLDPDSRPVLVVSRRAAKRIGVVSAIVLVVAGIAVGAFFLGRTNGTTHVALARSRTTQHNRRSHPAASVPTTTTAQPPATTTTTTTSPPPTTTTTSPRAAAPAASSAPLPEVASCAGPSAPAVKRPSLIGLGCASFNGGIQDITWTSWGPNEAKGTGTLYEETCIPDCASGNEDTYPDSTVELFGPVTLHGSLVFADLLVGTTATPLYSPNSIGGEGSTWGAGEQ